MKLYFHPGSASARKARITAALLGIDLDLQMVDIATGGHKKPEYLALNPNGLIPTLEDDGFVLWESSAICQYLAAKKSKPDLFPSDVKVRCQISQWQCWELAQWTPAVQSIVFERAFKKLFKMGPPDEAVVAKGLASFDRYAAVLDKHLEGKDFIVNNTLSLADVCIAAQLTHAAAAEVPVASHKNVARWFASFSKLEAWVKTVPVFG